MSIVIGLLKVVEVLCALALVMLVLLQRSRDDGMGLAFGNAMGESLFGAQATTILTKGTIVLAVIFMVNTVVLDRLSKHVATQSNDVDKVLATGSGESASSDVTTLPDTKDEGDSSERTPAETPSRQPTESSAPMGAAPVPDSATPPVSAAPANATPAPQPAL